MRINYNISSIIAQNALNNNDLRLSNSTKRLSSGNKINSSKDDAAGLAIARKMNMQIKSLERANRNANDGVSVVDTADGAMSEMHSILQRMNELSIQAATGTNSDTDRSQIQLEVDELVDEIDRIADTTQFNAQNLLDGSFAYKGYTDSENLKVMSYSEEVKKGIYQINSVEYYRYGDEKITYSNGSEDVKTKVEFEILNDDNNVKDALNMTDTDDVTGFPAGSKVTVDDEYIYVTDDEGFELKMYVNDRDYVKPETTDEVTTTLTYNDIPVKYHDATSGNDIEVTLGTLISTTVDDSSTQPPTTTISDGSATDDFADLLTELQNQNIAAGITAADIKSVEISNDKTKIIVSYGNNNPIDTIELNIVDANGNQSTIDDSLTTTTVGNQTTANDTVTTTTYKKITVTDDANPDKSYTISTLISKVEGDATTANIYSDEKGYSFESLENDLGIENISSVNIIEPANQGDVTKIEVNYNDENGAPATKTFSVDGTDKNGDPNTMDAFTYSTSVRERTKFTIGSKDSPINIDITKMGPMLVQTGANEGQQLAIEIPALNAINLGVNDLSVSTQDEATESIDTISKAINQLSSVRAKIGAYANRLEHTITNLNTTDETMTSAYSRIMDVDIAEEMTEYSTSQVLVQAATSVLSQANERPQQVLQLLQ